jgi:hypothetical protein
MRLLPTHVASEPIWKGAMCYLFCWKNTYSYVPENWLICWLWKNIEFPIRQYDTTLSQHCNRIYTCKSASWIMDWSWRYILPHILIWQVAFFRSEVYTQLLTANLQGLKNRIHHGVTTLMKAPIQTEWNKFKYNFDILRVLPVELKTNMFKMNKILSYYSKNVTVTFISSLDY